MRTTNSLNIVERFKGNSLKQRFSELKNTIVHDHKIPDLNEIYHSALEVKKLSAQIDEIVHATGIIQCLSKILEKNEEVIDLSLASSSEGEGIDLVTNKRIAEFKFARWQLHNANGMRKRQVFADLVNLYLHPTTKSKELYVFNAEMIKSFFSSSRAEWKNVLSRSGGLDKKLEEHLNQRGIYGKYLNDVYSISKVQVFDIDDIIT